MDTPNADAAPAPRRFGKRIVSAMSISYLIVALTLCVLRFATGDRLWVVLLATHLAHLWLWPAPFCALIAWRLHSRVAVIGALILSSVLVHDCGVWFLPARVRPRPNARAELRVLSWNLGLDYVDIDQVEAEIRRLHPDLILFQEPNADAFASLTRRFATAYPEGGLLAASRRIESKAWMSRRKPRSVALAIEAFGATSTNPRGELVFDFDGAPLHITNVHTSAMIAKEGTGWWSVPGWLAVADQCARRGSSLVAGDFNSTPNSPFIREWMKRGLQDCQREAGAGPGFSFPVAGSFRGIPIGPLVRIDYIWHTADLECLAIEVGAAGGSDHLPLLGVFRRSASRSGD